MERIPLDAYYTPDAVARACVATIADDIRGRSVLEPHAGDGAFVRAAMGVGVSEMIVNDIDGDCKVLREELGTDGFCADFLTWDRGSDWIDWTIGNPPFNDAERHVRHALDISRVGVAFLLRLAFLESSARVPFWQAHPPAEVYVFSRRPSFTGGKTDSCAYGWFVWRRGHTAAPRLGWLQW